MAKRKHKSIYPPIIRLIRGVFPILEKFAPSLAKKLAIQLFLTPVRFPFSQAENELLATYQRKTLSLNGEKVVYYEKGEGPVLILLHGWSGRGVQFKVMAEALVKAGYRCVVIDAPGHGNSTGKQSTLFQFADAFEQITSAYGDVFAVIGHSLGAASISYSISRGKDVRAFVVLGAPVIAQDILDTFSKTVNASHLVDDAIRSAAVANFGTTFDAVSMQTTFKEVHCPVLALHGEEDQDVSLNHLDYLKRLRPGLDARIYPEIGHRRILKDERVLEDIVRWLNARRGGQEPSQEDGQ